MGIRISGLKKRFAEREVLKGINLELGDTGLVFILGASGSGKSTLLNIIGALDTKYEGSVVVTSDRGRDFIFQDYNLINSLTVEENIKLSVELSGTSFDAERYEEILEKLGIKELEKRSAKDLSGGEKQRVAIARAILRNSPVILADEPTGNLDTENGTVIFELLKELSLTKLVLIVSHNAEAATEYGDRIIRIADGAVTEDSGLGQKTEAKQEEKETFQTVDKKKKRETWVWSCVFANLRYRKKKLIPMFVILCICLSCLGMVLGLKGGMDRATTNLTYKTMECDRYTFMVSGGSLISEEGIQWLETEEYIETAMIYDTYHLNVVVPTDVSTNPKCIVIDDSEIFKGRYTLSVGNYPKPGEIMLSENAAMELFGTVSCIGKTVQLSSMVADNWFRILQKEDPTRQIGCYTVAGVTTTSNDLNGEIYIQRADVEELLSASLYFPFFGVLTLLEKKAGEIDILQFKDKAKQENLLPVIGRLPEKDNEITPDISSAKRILIETGLIEKDEQSISEELLEQLLGTTYTLCYYDEELLEVSIVGFVEDAEELGDIVYVNRTIQTEELKYLTPFAMVYLNDISEETINALDRKAMTYGANYGLCRARANWAGSVLQTIEIMTWIMVAVTVLVLVVTICMVYYATKINIMERSYEMGVMKSMGAGNGFVFRIFFYEAVLLGTLAALCSGLFMMLVAGLNLLQMNGIPLLNISLPQLGILLAAGILVVVISGFAEIMKITRMPVVKAIGEKHV